MGKSANPQLPPKKTRQHHVWQRYLRSWTVGGSLHCLCNGRIFPSGTINVAVERDFYKLHRVTDDDVKFIWLLSAEKAHKHSRELHKQFLTMVTEPMKLIEQSPKSKELNDILDVYMTNALEDYYAGIESTFLPLLDRTLAGDIGFYADDKESIDFFHFICTQYMRTKGIKERTVDVFKEHNNRDISHVWNLMSYIFAVNIGGSLYVERKKRRLVLVNNDTNVPFVTGDQPIINLVGARPNPPEKLSMYYPVSPDRALILSEVDEAPQFTTDSLTESDVHGLNVKVLDASHSQVFGSSRKSLLQLRDLTQKRQSA